LTREEREEAVLDLIAGGEPAIRLPHAAVDPGHELNPGQRDLVAPRPRPVKAGKVSVKGRMTEEVIQRIVRQNFGRYRLCWENGLRTHPLLAGEIDVRFVIDKTGAVESSKSPRATLPDPDVVACVVRGFSNLSFPEPEDKRPVEVTYSLLLDPDG
jgi:hypothetical protein